MFGSVLVLHVGEATSGANGGEERGESQIGPFATPGFGYYW